MRSGSIVAVGWLVLMLCGPAVNGVDIPDHSSRKKHCVRQSSVKNAKGRVAVGIAGVSRGIRHTFATVERHVYGALDRAHLEFDVFLSTVGNVDFFGRPMDTFEASVVKPCLFSIVPQEILVDTLYTAYCKQRGYVCHADRIEAPNMTATEERLFNKRNSRYVFDLKRYLLCFNAQKRLAEMIRTHSMLHSFEYDAVLLIRPDVAFIRDIDLPALLPLIKGNTRQIWIPDFQPFGGLNDRAAFGSQSVMLKYLERGDSFMTNSSYRMQVAEPYLGQYLQNQNIQWQKSSMRFMRVRPMEDNNTDLGIIDGLDIKPKQLNVHPNDQDLLRCTGPIEYTHIKLNFPYKPIQTDVC